MERDFGKIRIQHAGIHVHNLDETEQWYEEILGFEKLGSGGGGPEQAAGVFPKCRLMKNGDFYLEIYEVLDAKPFSFVELEYSVGVKHLNFSVEKLDALMDYIYERGDVKVLVDNYYPEERCGIPGGDRAVYITDNNGILVELSAVHDR